MSQTNATEAVNKEEENVIKENVLPDKEPTNVEEVVVVDVEELLKNGRRNLFCKEIQLAVNQLQEACSILSKKHGELGFECASAYYDYGLALLELSRMENGVLGNALQGITEEVGTENDDKEEDEEEDKEDDGGDSDGKKRKKEERSVDEEFVEEDGTTEEEKEKISDQILDAMVDKEEEEAIAGENKEEEGGEKMEEAASTTAAVAEDGRTFSQMSHHHAAPSRAQSLPQTKTTHITPGEKIKEENDPKKVTSKVESDDKPVEDADGKKKEEDEEDAMEADGDGGEEAEEEDGGDDGEEKADDEEEGKGDDGDEKQDNVSQTEDVSNLQLAWEMIELSKTIYKKRQESEVEDKTATTSMDAKELILKQADCYMKLGEIGVESEMYTQAIEDFQTSYDLLLSVPVAPDDRRLAEVKYQLGLASVYATNYEGAVQNFEDALAIIEVRIKNFENKLKDLGEVGAGDGDKKGDGEKVGGGDDKDGGEGKGEGVKEIIEEIEELKSLVPDIKMKIEDAVEERKSMLSLKDVVKDDLVATVDKKKESESSECIGFSEAKNKSSDEQPAADDITHLVRKKRKQQDTELSEEDTNKKLKVEPVVVVAGNETDGPIPVAVDGKDDVTPSNGFHDDKENDKKVSNKIEEDMDVEKKTAVVDADDENNSSTKTTSTTTTTVTAAEQLAN